MNATNVDKLTHAWSACSYAQTMASQISVNSLLHYVWT